MSHAVTLADGRKCDMTPEQINSPGTLTQIAEQEGLVTARNREAFDDLLSACQRLTKHAECTCHDLGEGMLCDVCEGKAAIAKALAANRG